ncbi:hypothetical protein [Methylobacterium sp. 10]|uniref:HNH endonuclease n=1 Tax=Methylobacterium sp. 10 TaxID=1101191 RepID=UPI0012DDEDA9|nr:hypothetical protein [Methylobacterium sp. 10]
MPTCSVRWRPSGGRGEFEYVPGDSLTDRDVRVYFEALGLTIDAEVVGRKEEAQGKPRLRKHEPNNRKKFHLPQLVLAVARFPEFARQDLAHSVEFPLENKAFVMDAMEFDIIEEDEETVILAPLYMSILHSDVRLNLNDRLRAVAEDFKSVASIRARHPDLADAVEEHERCVRAGVNDVSIRTSADIVIALQADIFGKTNAGSTVEVEKFEALPPSEFEDILAGKEGRLLTRMHSYKERDRELTLKAKQYYKSKAGGRLKCVACSLDPIAVYGPEGERCIHAHHTTPIEELQPDSITTVHQLAMVCASCHMIIHSRKPCLSIEEIQSLLESAKAA